MRTTMKTILALCLVAGAILTGCKKGDKGDIGPQGPAGTNGTNGTNGNANVVGQTFTVTAWTQSSPSYYTNISVPSITQLIVDKGAVLVYMSNGSGGWTQLPLTYPVTATYSKNYEVVHYLGGFTIWVTDSDLTQAVNPGTKVFKVIIIEGIRIKSMPYEELKQKFGLTD